MLPTALAILVLLSVTIWCLIRKPALGFCAAWFFIILAPTSSFIPIRDPIFEHRMYLALAGVIVLLVLAARAGLDITEQLDFRKAYVSTLRASVELEDFMNLEKSEGESGSSSAQ